MLNGQYLQSQFNFVRKDRIGREMFIPIAQRLSDTLEFLTLQAVLFVLAHEVGHIMLGHTDRPRPSTQEARWEEETQADLSAAARVIALMPDLELNFGNDAPARRRLWQGAV